MKFDDIFNKLLTEANAQELHPGHDPEAMKAANRPAYTPSRGNETSVIRGKSSRVTDIFNPRVNRPTYSDTYGIRITNTKNGTSFPLTKNKETKTPFSTEEKEVAMATARRVADSFKRNGKDHLEVKIIGGPSAYSDDLPWKFYPFDFKQYQRDKYGVR